MDKLCFYLLFMAAILMSASADVCACSPCSSYTRRHDRCECCRYIQNGKKRSDPSTSLAMQPDNHDSPKLDAASFFNLENPSSQRQVWMPVSQSEKPCGPTSSQLPNDTENYDCIQSETSSAEKVANIFYNILLESRSPQAGLRPRSSYSRNIDNKRHLANFIFPPSNPEVLPNFADSKRRRRSSLKNISSLTDLRRLFGWKAPNKPGLAPAQFDDFPIGSFLPSDLATPDDFGVRGDATWS